MIIRQGRRRRPVPAAGTRRGPRAAPTLPRGSPYRGRRRGLGARLLDGRGPVGTRETGQVRYAGLEVRRSAAGPGLVAPRAEGAEGGEAQVPYGRGLVAGSPAADVGDPGGGSGAAGQVSLGQQPPVESCTMLRETPSARASSGGGAFPGAEPAAPDRPAGSPPAGRAAARRPTGRAGPTAPDSNRSTQSPWNRTPAGRMESTVLAMSTLTQARASPRFRPGS